jgi:hypothetical protein
MRLSEFIDNRIFYKTDQKEDNGKQSTKTAISPPPSTMPRKGVR